MSSNTVKWRGYTLVEKTKYNYQIDKLAARFADEVKKNPRKKFEEVAGNARKETANVYCCLLYMTLNSDYGFGPKRINNLIKAIKGQFDGIFNGTINPKDIVDWCIQHKMDFSVFDMGSDKDE